MLSSDDLKQIKQIVNEVVDPLAKDVSDVKQDLKDVKKRVRKIEKTTDDMIKFFNKEDIRLDKRVTRIENHLGLTSQN